MEQNLTGKYTERKKTEVSFEDTTRMTIALTYIKMQKGILYILNNIPNTDITSKDPVNIVNIDGTAYLACKNIVAAFTDEMSNHLEKLIDSSNEINLFFYSRSMEEYETRHAFTITINRKNCATLLGLYEIVKNSRTEAGTPL